MTISKKIVHFKPDEIAELNVSDRLDLVTLYIHDDSNNYITREFTSQAFQAFVDACIVVRQQWDSAIVARDKQENAEAREESKRVEGARYNP